MPGWKFPLLIIVLLLTSCVDAAATMEFSTQVPTAQEPFEKSITNAPSLSPTSFPTATLTISSTSSPTQIRGLAMPFPTLGIPTITTTAVPQPAPLSGAIQFYKPGPMSQVTSPVKFFGYAVPGYNHSGIIELFGEDGNLLDSEVLQLSTAYKWAFFSWSLDFRARGAGEMGRLSLSTRDQYGRITAIRSIHLFLMNHGPQIITPAEMMVERVVLETPLPGKRLSGGHVDVMGEMQSYNEEPVIVDLVKQDGTIIASQLVPVPPGEGGKHFKFRIDIPYKVTTTIPILLSISQPDDVIPGIIYQYSQDIFLSP